MHNDHADDQTIGRVLTRRQLIRLVGTSAGAAVVASYAAAPFFGKSKRRRPFGALSAQAQTIPSCVVRPALTEGPYFVDEGLDRSDIRSDPTTGVVKDGALLALSFLVARIDGSSCTPFEGAVVDLWHCDALGVYSDVSDPGFDTTGQKFLRGYQVTGDDGAADFVTIYPGWYQGRTVHMHFKIRTGQGASETLEFTSQLFFDDALTDVVHAASPYSAKGQRTLRNSGDNIYQNGGSQLLLGVTDDGAGGYAATFEIGIYMSAGSGTSTTTSTTTTTLAAGTCTTIADCLAGLANVLPDPNAASTAAAMRTANRLQTRALRLTRNLDRAAAATGAKQETLYAKALARLERMRVLAVAADARGALEVSLDEIESAIDALIAAIPA